MGGAKNVMLVSISWLAGVSLVSGRCLFLMVMVEYRREVGSRYYDVYFIAK